MWCGAGRCGRGGGVLSKIRPLAGARAEHLEQPLCLACVLAAGGPERHYALPPEGRTAVNEDEARRKIAALKAIVQAMLHEVCRESGSKTWRKQFDLRLEDDEVLAMAIANELGADELAHAFDWTAAGFASGREELAANPVTPHLRDGQRMRARVALLAQEEVDHAHTLAVRAPDRPGVTPMSADERVQLAEEAFLGRLEIDVLHEREGWSGFTTTAKANPDQRLACLPEPWRKHATKGLPELRARIMETLGPARTEEPERG